MVIDKEPRELTDAEIVLVAGGKRITEAKEKIKELQKDLKDTGDHGSKGAGASSQLAA